MALWQWSTTAANNANADPTIDWAEGQPPSTVNDSARAMMAAVAVSWQNGEWQNQGDVPTYVSGTQFTVPANRTSVYTVGRRVRTFNTGGTVYGTITASAFASVTTVTITPDSGSLDSGLSEVDVGILNALNKSLPPVSGALLNIQTITAVGPYTATPGANRGMIELLGAGGAGGGSSGVLTGGQSAAPGGNAGGFLRLWIPSNLQSYSGTTVTPGAAGVGAAGAVGGNGGNSTFGALATAFGGIGGPTSGGFAGPIGGEPVSFITAVSAINTQLPMTTLTALLSLIGEAGGDGFASSVASGVTRGGDGGSSLFGSGGYGARISSTSTAATAGSGYGSGGGGAAVNSGVALAGGNGAPGLFRIYEFA